MNTCCWSTEKLMNKLICSSCHQNEVELGSGADRICWWWNNKLWASQRDRHSSVSGGYISHHHHSESGKTKSGLLSYCTETLEHVILLDFAWYIAVMTRLHQIIVISPCWKWHKIKHWVVDWLTRSSNHGQHTEKKWESDIGFWIAVSADTWERLLALCSQPKTT